MYFELQHDEAAQTCISFQVLIIKDVDKHLLFFDNFVTLSSLLLHNS